MRAETSTSLWQQSCPLLGTSYCKTKAFPYCILAHTHTLLYHLHKAAMVHIQLTPEFPENLESTELKIMWVSAMYVMAGIFIKDHDSRGGEPVFVKTCPYFPVRDTWDQVCCVAVPRARASKRKWLSCPLAAVLVWTNYKSSCRM